ncbi:penicillin-binding protein 2 [Candidatus Parcubacteria bacterium]|nr:penicillin-binding protein 2 [Candidatus Parcubacteria bacterium]
MVRGNIYFQNPQQSSDSGTTALAATNKKFPIAYTVPSLVTNSDEISTKLAKILDLDQDQLHALFKSGSTTTKIIARRLTDQQASDVEALKSKGVGIKYEMDRSYPSDSLAASVLGFFGFSSEGKSGQYGVESYFNNELTGVGQSAAVSDQPGGLLDKLKGYLSLGTSVATDKFKVQRPGDVVLTIDKNIQTYAELKLEEVLKRWNAAGGTVIIQDPQTGKILAMADRPTFDPNKYSSSKPSNYLNKSVQEVFEPGSSFKPITMAMGLDLNKVTPQTTFTDTGFLEIAGHTIKNYDEKAHGTVTMSQILEKSLNTGAMFVESLVGDEHFLNYAINLGFGQKTGVDLPGEVNGDIANLYSGRKINYLTASFGQGIAVTPLQLINAYSAIANGGKLMKPYAVEKVVFEGGKEEVTKPEVVAIPFSEKTSQKLRTMLVSVVDNGFDKARIKGYDIAGKTGTAQIPDGKGGYEKDIFIHDFLGFAPASNPKFVILLKMDRPQGITFAADSLSPTFKEIAQYLINYYNIPPTR